MTAGALLIELHTQEGDTNLMLDGWIKLSDEKGYPKTEEGLRRYLSRIKSGQGKFPQRKGGDERKPATDPAPEEFISWWKEHPHGGDDGPSARVAFNCQTYRQAWQRHQAGAFAAQATGEHDTPF
jgi:hypothetical protein